MRVQALMSVLMLGGLVPANAASADYDIMLRGGTVYDGTGDMPFVGDVAISGDRIAAVGTDIAGDADLVIDASGLVVAPGFINMLSWGAMTLINDGTGLSDLVQGVTLQVFGEGWSLGPINERVRNDPNVYNNFGVFRGPWTTLGEALAFLEDKGVASNVASMVGATTIRIHELQFENRAPDASALANMRALVRQAMEEGAMGLGTSLIYAPAVYATNEELIAMAKVAAEYDGMITAHMRSEGGRLLEALDEFLGIAQAAKIRAEVLHFKALGEPNWAKLAPAIARIESARRGGMEVTANMYAYIASGTGLTACFPPWIQEGGHAAMIERLQDPEHRARALEEATSTEQTEWENQFRLVRSADDIMLLGFQNPDLQALKGRTLADVAEERGQSPMETAFDLVVEDNSRVLAIYFTMTEDNIRRKIQLPYMHFGSDERAFTPGAPQGMEASHPRA